MKNNLSVNRFRFLTVSLKGISQVILIENAVTGAIILLAIMVSSFSLGVIALLSAMIGALVGRLGGADDKLVNQGLFGFNSVLTGMALYLFLTGPYHWILSLIGAFLAAIVTAALMHVMKNTGLPVLTFPFVGLTLFTLLISYRLSAVHISNALVPQSLWQWKLDITGPFNLKEGIFTGIGQVFFLDYTISGILLFVAVFWAGWRYGLYALLGNAVALVTALVLGAERSLIFVGLYGYNGILTAIAVAVVFNTSKRQLSYVTGIFAACLTVPITSSLHSWLLPFGLPPLTMPFVLSTWIVLSARKVLPRL